MWPVPLVVSMPCTQAAVAHAVVCGVRVAVSVSVAVAVSVPVAVAVVCQLLCEPGGGRVAVG
eukprot:361535-Chlamydomonas_euryale.AAC.2